MTTITVTKDGEGKLIGCGEKDKEAWNRFVRMTKELEPGEIFTISHWFPRNPKFHALHFVMLTTIFDAQEQFHNVDHLRKWLTVGAGHCIEVPGPRGRPVEVADSINFNTLDDEQFKEHHEKVKEFLRSTYATRFLWPHLSDDKASEMVETILEQFERQ